MRQHVAPDLGPIGDTLGKGADPTALPHRASEKIKAMGTAEKIGSRKTSFTNDLGDLLEPTRPLPKIRVATASDRLRAELSAPHLRRPLGNRPRRLPLQTLHGTHRRNTNSTRKNLWYHDRLCLGHGDRNVQPRGRNHRPKRRLGGGPRQGGQGNKVARNHVNVELALDAPQQVHSSVEVVDQMHEDARCSSTRGSESLGNTRRQTCERRLERHGATKAENRTSRRKH